MNGADALKRALENSSQSKEDRIVDEAFKLLTPVIKGWLRARVRQGSSVLESVAKLSTMLEAGQSIASAAGGVLKAVRDVSRAAGKGRK